MKLGDKPFSLPTSWEDITVAQYLTLRKTNLADFCETLHVLTGLPREEWFNAREIDFVEKLLPRIAYLATPVDFSSYSIPASIAVDGKEYLVPKDIRFRTFGQKLTFQSQVLSHIDEEGNISVDFVALACAIYLVDDPFTDERAFALADRLRLLPMCLIYPTAAFFLNSSLNS